MSSISEEYRRKDSLLHAKRNLPDINEEYRNILDKVKLENPKLPNSRIIQKAKARLESLKQERLQILLEAAEPDKGKSRTLKKD